MNDNKILANLHSPEELEKLYHEDRSRFSSWLDSALDEFPDSETLLVWKARLDHSSGFAAAGESRSVSLMFVVLTALAAGFFMKFPDMFGISPEWFYPRFAPAIVIGSLVAYHFGRVASNRARLVLAGGFTLCIALAWALPERSESDSLLMAMIHLPLLLGPILAVAHSEGTWRGTQNKLMFVRYLGEMFIYSTLILLGGVVMTLLTLGLFDAIGVDITEFYEDYVIVFGLTALPVVATYLYDSVLKRDSRVAVLISNTFSPLFLLTVVAYLFAFLLQGRSPFSDREFLVLLNGALLVFTSMALFSLSGMEYLKYSRLMNGVNIALVGLTVLLSLLAIGAVAYRTYSFGITPNRVAVFGTDVLVCIHLVRILRNYWAKLAGNVEMDRLGESVAGFLPAYSLWALFVVGGLPLLFQFK